jgi:hypothetical protein
LILAAIFKGRQEAISAPKLADALLWDLRGATPSQIALKSKFG